MDRPDRTYAGRKDQALKRKEGRSNVIAARLKQARHEHNPPWTMDDLSQAVEVRTGFEISVGTIGKIESGARSVYDWEVLAFIRVLGRSADWLLSADEDSSVED